jgi:hypothetical protein
MGSVTNWNGLTATGHQRNHVTVTESLPHPNLCEIEAAMPEKNQKLRTVDVVTDELTMVKPSELIECTELAPLTLADRRTYNLLLLNAWDSIAEDKSHVIAKKELRGLHNVNNRLGKSIERLMGVVCSTQIVRSDGKNYTRRFHLLETSDEENDNDDMGLLYYNFPTELRRIIKNSTQFARLKKEIIFALSSKYALALYELVSKRVNLKHKKTEEIPLDRFRVLLGVEEGKLREFKHFKSRAIDPSVLEVNGLAEFGCKVEPVCTGRKVTAVKLSWWAKTDEEKKAAIREVQGSKVGRRARLTGKVDTILPPPAALPAPRPEPKKTPSNYGRPGEIGNLLLKTRTYEMAKEIAPKLDIYYLESEWREWAQSRGEQVNFPDAAFINFVKSKVKQHPA